MTDTSLALPWRSPFNRTGVWVSDGWHINTEIRAVMGADEHGPIVVHAGLNVES